MAELASQPTSIQSVYTWYREDRLYVNRLYQRKLVWTLNEKQKLIESILKKYPIPAILIAEKEDKQGAFEIIDGLSRHSTVSMVSGSTWNIFRRRKATQRMAFLRRHMEIALFHKRKFLLF